MDHHLAVLALETLSKHPLQLEAEGGGEGEAEAEAEGEAEGEGEGIGRNEAVWNALSDRLIGKPGMQLDH